MNTQSIERHSQDELRVILAALKAISQGVVISDANRLIVSVNRAFSEITQYPIEEILNINCKFLQGPDSDQETIKRMHDALRAGIEFTGEILNYKKDGTPFWNDLTITPIYDETGTTVTHFVGITRDVTKNKEIEAQLRAQLDETKRLNQIMVDRELKMIELKEKLAQLEQKLEN